VVCPFVADQPFWARIAQERGVAPDPLPQRSLTSEALAERSVAGGQTVRAILPMRQYGPPSSHQIDVVLSAEPEPTIQIAGIAATGVLTCEAQQPRSDHRSHIIIDPRRRKIDRLKGTPFGGNRPSFGTA
jgi:hypothetical protein